jgi:hypothetical protein
MWETLLDAFLDTIKILPVLLLAYVLIEFIELKTSKTIEHSKLLKSKYAPLFGAGIGLVPQCGFSVVATDLYTKKRISLGTLLAMYIATSDEAIPILLSYPDQYKNLAIILIVKFVLAVLVGYLTMIFLKYIYKAKPEFVGIKTEKNIKNNTIQVQDKTVNHNYFVGEVMLDEPESHHVGCCGHDIEESSGRNKVWGLIYHPIMHCLKIMAFIFAVYVVFGLIIYLVGEEALMGALNTVKYAQPFIAGLIGLIPNCAASVVITNLFAMGGLSLGACISGLVANAGLGLTILAKQNTNKKHTLYIIFALYVISVVSGLIITLF